MGKSATECAGHYPQWVRRKHHYPTYSTTEEARWVVYKKVAEAMEVLEISKGAWTEAIFAKEKPMDVVTRTKFPTPEELSKKNDLL